MGLDLWFRDDVLRILGAVCAGMGGAVAANTPLDQEYAVAYRQGFEDAVRAMAVGFGVADQRSHGGAFDRSGVPTFPRSRVR